MGEGVSRAMELFQTVIESGGWPAVVAVALSWLSSRKIISRLVVSVLRLELLNLIQHYPGKTEIILKTYDKYKAMGGNSYIDEVVKNWKAKRKDEEI